MPTLIERGLGRLFPKVWLSRRFEPAFRDGPSVHWLRMNVNARREFGALDVRRLTQVGIFAFARGGSHFIESQFHMLPCGFCFNEGLVDYRTDVNWRTFLCRGMFGPDSVQDKTAGTLTHLFYNCNNIEHHLDHEAWSADRDYGFARRWVFSLRNPLRTLLSRHDARKERWQLTAENVDKFFHWYNAARRRFSALLEKRGGETAVVIVEQFAADPAGIFNDLCAHLGIAAGCVAARSAPQQFFKSLGRTGESPVVRNGYLASPRRDLRIVGWGGDFNPILPVSEDRLYAHDLKQAYSGDLLSVIRRHLSAEALELFMTDASHRYAGVNPNHLLTI